MPSLTRDQTVIEYRLFGQPTDPPVLLIAPGGMSSTIGRWPRAPWNPLTELDGFYRVAMDQRNAGESTAPIQPGDGWARYTADQVALLDHLGLEQVHVVGMCIGGPYGFGLMKAIPDRIKSAVLMQPIGLENNRHLFYDLFDQWAAGLASQHPEATPATWQAFRTAMFGGDFLFNTTREEVAACTTPMLILMGDDPYHPNGISREVARLAPRATLLERWRDPADHAEAIDTVRAFLHQHN